MASAPEWLSLEPGEEVVWTGKPRLRRILTTVASGVLWSVVALVAAYLLATGIVDVLPPNLPFRTLLPWAGALVIVANLVVSVVRAYLKTTNVDYVLTDRNVYKKTGVFSENVTRVSLEKIQNTQLKKDFFGNTFDYGTVLVSTAGGSGIEMAITDLDDPQVFRNELRTRVADASGDDRETPVHSNPFATADPDAVATAIDEARSMRETAQRIEQRFT